MTVICTKCGALSVHQCQCLNPVTLTGHQTPLPPTEPAKPELDSCYRWVNIGERIIGTDEYLTGYGEWMQTGGLEFKCTVAKKYRRRIEPQAEPAKPERQTSEIEKRAAMALVELFKNTIEECVMTRRLESLRGRCTEYIEAYDYAKSIGAIE